MYRSIYIRICICLFIGSVVFLSIEKRSESAPLIKNSMNESERNKVLSSYFSPSFNEVLEVDLKASINRDVKDPYSSLF